MALVEPCLGIQFSAWPRIDSKSRRLRFPHVHCRASKRDEQRTPPTADASLGVKSVWYLSEVFGNVAAAFRKFQIASTMEAEGKEQEGEFEVVSRELASELIRKDYEQSYFVTGKMTTGIYNSDCEFADPFVSFKGLKRFKQNVSNLGAFMEKSTLKIASWEQREDSIIVGWRFSCVLSLPWRPIISATGSTEYVFDDKFEQARREVEHNSSGRSSSVV